jgi:hypothetical protein
MLSIESSSLLEKSEITYVLLITDSFLLLIDPFIELLMDLLEEFLYERTIELPFLDPKTDPLLLPTKLFDLIDMMAAFLLIDL